MCGKWSCLAWLYLCKGIRDFASASGVHPTLHPGMYVFQSECPYGDVLGGITQKEARALPLLDITKRWRSVQLTAGDELPIPPPNSLRSMVYSSTRMKIVAKYAIQRCIPGACSPDADWQAQANQHCTSQEHYLPPVFENNTTSQSLTGASCVAHWAVPFWLQYSVSFDGVDDGRWIILYLCRF